MAGGKVEIHPATADRFADLAQILGPGADVPACWCLYYRVTSSEFASLRGKERPDRLRRLCEQDDAPGVIAYVDGSPAGWCAFGPRSDMGRLQRSRTIQKVDDVPVWSIVCFVVKAGYRRQGLAHELLDAAVTYARSRSVPALEAYPVESGPGRISSAFAYVGTTPLFEAAGFRPVEPTQSRSGGRSRWIVRLSLG